jgi:hypothetical protein
MGLVEISNRKFCFKNAIGTEGIINRIGIQVLRTYKLTFVPLLRGLSL